MDSLTSAIALVIDNERELLRYALMLTEERREPQEGAWEVWTAYELEQWVEGIIEDAPVMNPILNAILCSVRINYRHLALHYITKVREGVTVPSE